MARRVGKVGDEFVVKPNFSLNFWFNLLFHFHYNNLLDKLYYDVSTYPETTAINKGLLGGFM